MLRTAMAHQRQQWLSMSKEWLPYHTAWIYGAIMHPSSRHLGPARRMCRGTFPQNELCLEATFQALLNLWNTADPYNYLSVQRL